MSVIYNSKHYKKTFRNKVYIHEINQKSAFFLFMISPKLLMLLQNFPKSEIKSFRKFIQSPFHNENDDLIILFEIIEKQIKKDNQALKENTNLTKEIVWKKIKGNSPYHDEQMRRMSSDLIKKIYSFLSYQQYQKNQLNELITLLPLINTPQMDKHFSGILRQIELIQKKCLIQNADSHLENYKIENNKFTKLEIQGKKLKTFENLENLDFHLDCFYICKKLKNYCDVLAYSNFQSVKPNIRLFPDFLNYLSTSEYLQEPSIKAYFLIAHMLLSPKDESIFQNLKIHLDDNYVIFPQPELKSLYIYLINYCIDTKINNGQSEYFKALFEIFKIVIEKEIMFNDGLLAPQDYKNIISVGLHIKEFDWVENFIQNYTNRLPKESQDNDLSYNLAKVYFHKKDYENVIEQLRSVEYKNLAYTMGGRLMLLKTYYELKELDALESLLDSYSIYLRRNKLISREVKQQLMNGIRFTRKLSSLAPYDKKGIQKLKDQINNCKALAAKKWLLEKVGEME